MQKCRESVQVISFGPLPTLQRLDFDPGNLGDITSLIFLGNFSKLKK